jgi:tetratricopeptide (TPR) repeat protein
MDITTEQAFEAARRDLEFGRLGPAEQRLGCVLAREPNAAEAHNLLGMIAFHRGDLPTATDHLRQAVNCIGATADHWSTLGVFHSLARNFPEAVAAYEQALRLRPVFPEASSNLGLAWQALGELERALPCQLKAVRERPSMPEAHHNLGCIQHELGNYAEAAAAFEQALWLKPDYADASHNLGIVFHDNGDLERAISWYRYTLRLRPDHTNALNSLATALKEEGRLQEALPYYHEALRLQPDHALAYFNLSQYVAEGRYRFTAEELERMRGYVNTEHRSPLERSLFAFILAGVRDREGSYEEAFTYYRQANDLRLDLLKTSHRAFDPQQHEALVDRVIARFNRAYFEHIRGWGTDSELPIFIVGMPRSGSTLVEQILASHPQVFGAGELGEIPRVVKRLAKAAGDSDLYGPAFPPGDPALARRLATEFHDKCSGMAPLASRVALKTLENFLHLGFIAMLFPHARVIHCRRDPLDVCLSCYFQNFQGLNYTWSLDDLGFYYRQYERLMAHWREVLPLRIHEVVYEDMVKDQQGVSRELLTFCGLNWDDRCLEFFNTQRIVRTSSTLQVRKPISESSVGRWKRYRSHLEPLVRALGERRSVSPPVLPPAG